MKTALLVIDLQNDFTSKQGKVPACTKQLPEVIERINEAIEQRKQRRELTALVTTRWSNPFIRLLTRNSVKPGSHGAEVDERLTKDIGNHFVKANKDIFSSSDLVDWLNENEVEELILCGLALEHCIRVSTKVALSRGYTVSLLNGGTAPYKCEQREKALADLQKLGVTLHES